MYIRKLEIFGFKSFKNKTVLEFNEGITGVVGPNGCGKSNIVDALLWVMGETAPKHLRSSSFSDVIFGGTNVHPEGDLAEVSLVLAKGNGVFPGSYNHFSELMITRRAFRGGETEYQINKQTCRLKDIHEIFMNTGAGCRGFSIIEQEAVEKLITANPVERRFIIEEVAGITKFKTRRGESIRKLDKVNQNLQRIEDILKTQDQQFQSLNRQAKKATKYRMFKEGIRKRDIELGHRLWNDMSERQGELREQEQSHIVKKQELKDRIKVIQGRMKKQEEEIKQTEAILEKEKLYLSDVSCKIVEREKEIEKRGEAVSIYKNSLEKQKNSRENFQKELEDRRQRIEELDEQRQALKASENRIRKEVQEQETFLSTKKDSHREQSIEKQIQTDRETLHRVAIRSSVIKSRKEILDQTRDKLSREKMLLEEKLRKIFKEKSKRTATLEKSQQMNFDFTKNTEELDKNIQVLEAEKKQSEIKVNRLKQDISALKHKIDNMDQLIYKCENLQKGSEELKSWKPDQFKPLIESLKVEPGFENAAEAALGLFLKSFITPDNYFIEHGISWLKENKKGKCVFISGLPLNDTPLFEREELNKFPSFICSLDEKITFTLEMEPLRILARQTAVVSDLRSAFELKTRYPDLQFVTKEGDFITKESFVYGGSHDKETNTLKMRNERSRWMGEAKANETVLKRAESELDQQTRRLDHFLKEYKQITTNQSQTEVFIAEHKKDLELFKREIFRLTEEREALLQQEQKTGEEDRTLKRELQDIEKEEQRLNRMIQTKETTLSQIQKSNVEYETAEKRVSALKISLVENLNQQNMNEKEKSILMNLMSQSQDREKEFVGNFVSVQKTIREEEERIREVSKELKLFVEEKGQVTAQVREMDSQRGTLQEAVAQAKESVENLNNDQNQMEREEGYFQSEREKIDIQKQNLKEKLFENHQFRLEEDSFIPEWDDISVEELKESIGNLEREIEKTGPVNLVALKERDELMEKNDFLRTQKEDLTKSRTDLLKVISHIDGICGKRFNVMLEEINLRFSRIFPLIFNGENAEARLILHEDPEKGETGVDIRIRPPGKKLQNVALLSRGEKALTSLCLIYSLFLVKPSPFCVLDEIDAPLDDANVMRFLSVMREMASRSQIITITHNKHTMRACSQLYGVTMKEKGVSQIVSVNLEGPEVPSPPAP
ncbi:MAG: chromosome segregation protein SMC [Bdellovibrionales bacterium]|nr:chromosome segregation protein SMC [Bdellovibrionales bacterium]